MPIRPLLTPFSTTVFHASPPFLHSAADDNDNDGSNDDDDASSSRARGKPDPRLGVTPREPQPTGMAQLPFRTDEEHNDGGGASDDDPHEDSAGIVGEHWPHPPCAPDAVAADVGGDGGDGGGGGGWVEEEGEGKSCAEPRRVGVGGCTSGWPMPDC